MSGPRPLSRNSTSFPLQVATKVRELHREWLAARDQPRGWASLLKYYQWLVRRVMSDPEWGIGADGNGRGLLLYATMGLGKTREAVAVAMAMWDVRRPVVALPRGLRRNFKRTIEAVVALLAEAGVPAAELAERQRAAVARFSFVSLDAFNAADQLERLGRPRKQAALAAETLEGKLLIVDEAHNFFRAVINGGERSNARRMYDQVMSARDLRIIFLTGTPCSKNPFELVPCFNMLAGFELLPTAYESWVRLYVDRDRMAVRNRGLLANRLVGLVSHVSTSRPTEPGAGSSPPQPGDEGWFPVELPVRTERVEMAPEQYRRYVHARDRENAEMKLRASGRSAGRDPPALSLPGSERKGGHTYFVASRTRSTFCPPLEWDDAKLDDMPDEAFSADSGPKLALAADRALAAPGPVLIYSQFIERGLAPLERFLARRGYRRWRWRSAAGGAAADPRAELPRLLQTRARLRLLDGTDRPYEARAAFERWLISAENRSSGPDELEDKFIAELVAGRAVDSVSRASRLFQALADVPRPAPEPDAVAVVAGGELVVRTAAGDVSVGGISPERIRLLTGIAAGAGLSPQAAVDAAAAVALRYESLAPAGQQWGLPLAHFDRLWGAGFRGEGFASPINSRFAGRPGGAFCSLFPDTDSVFGSLGDFFGADLPAAAGGRWIVNPPFVESLMDRAVARVAEAARKSGSFEALVLLPAWEDSAAVRRLRACAAHVERLCRGRFHVENAVGSSIPARFDAVYAVVVGRGASPQRVSELRALARDPRAGGPRTGGPRTGGPRTGGADEPAQPALGPEPAPPESPPAPAATAVAAAAAPAGPARHYAVIAGGIPEDERAAIIARFNSPENARGALIQAILVSKAGAEGLDLRWVRETHQLEPYWNSSRDDQVRTRAIRMGSHDGLPREERSVQPYVYVAIANASVQEHTPPESREAESIDEQFWRSSREGARLNDDFRELLAEVSLECGAFGYGRCRSCRPDGAPLWTASAEEDAGRADPCQACAPAETVSAEQIELDGTIYYRAPDPGSPLGFRLWVKRPDLDAMVPLAPDHPAVPELLAHPAAEGAGGGAGVPDEWDRRVAAAEQIPLLEDLVAAYRWARDGGRRDSAPDMDDLQSDVYNAAASGAILEMALELVRLGRTPEPSKSAHPVLDMAVEWSKRPAEAVRQRLSALEMAVPLAACALSGGDPARLADCRGTAEKWWSSARLSVWRQFAEEVAGAGP